MSDKSPEQKSLGLSVYRGVAKYTSPLTEKRGQRAVSIGKEEARRISERYGRTQTCRADGVLIWLHAADLAQCFSLIELIGRLATRYPEAGFLLTTTERVPEDVMAARLPANTVHQYAPYDTPNAAADFLDHWQPDVCLWSEQKMMPLLLQDAAERNTPLIYLNAIQPNRSLMRLRWVPGVAGSVLNLFSVILAIDEKAAAGLRKLGAQPDKIEVIGELREGSTPLAVDEATRSYVAKQLQGRPVWLAAHVDETEEDWIIQGHKIAQRSTHRLLTILSPSTCAQIENLAQKLAASNLNVARRSDPASLSPLTDILLADVPNELGLWYRIASVSFVGNSLTHSGGGMNPGEPAALGSAIIHGPNVKNFADSFYRLAKVGAAIEVQTVESLAEAVSEILSPDRAAEMAHAAWVSNSEGADVTDFILENVAVFLGYGGDDT